MKISSEDSSLKVSCITVHSSNDVFTLVLSITLQKTPVVIPNVNAVVMVLFFGEFFLLISGKMLVYGIYMNYKPACKLT